MEPPLFKVGSEDPPTPPPEPLLMTLSILLLAVSVVTLVQLVGAADCRYIVTDPVAIKSGILLHPVRVVAPNKAMSSNNAIHFIYVQLIISN